MVPIISKVSVVHCRANLGAGDAHLLAESKYPGTYTAKFGESSFLALEVETGEQGWFGPIFISAVSDAIKALDRHLLGAKVDEHLTILDQLRSVQRFSYEFIPSQARSAIDIALWQLRSKLYDISPARLIGRFQRDAVPFCCSVLGVRAVECKVIENTLLQYGVKPRVSKWTLPCQEHEGVSGLRANCQAIENLRRVLGSEATIIIECNRAFSSGYLRQLIPAFKDSRIFAVEDPLQRQDEFLARRLFDHTEILFMGGEDIFSMHEFAHAALEGRYDIYHIEPCWAEGITGALRRLELVERFGRTAYLHGTSLPMAGFIASFFNPSVVPAVENHLKLNAYTRIFLKKWIEVTGNDVIIPREIDLQPCQHLIEDQK